MQTDEERVRLITFRIPPEINRATEQAAKREMISPTAFARRALLRALESEQRGAA